MVTKTALVIDSNPGVLVVAKSSLARVGYEALTATSAEEGMQRAIRHSPDVVLIDAACAKEEVLLDLAWSQSKRIPIVIMVLKGTDRARYEARARSTPSLSRGIAEVIEKPFSSEVLLETIERALAKSPAAQPGRIAKRMLRTAAYQRVKETVPAKSTASAPPDAIDISDVCIEDVIVTEMMSTLDPRRRPQEASLRVAKRGSLLEALLPRPEPEPQATREAPPPPPPPPPPINLIEDLQAALPLTNGTSAERVFAELSQEIDQEKQHEGAPFKELVDEAASFEHRPLTGADLLTITARLRNPAFRSETRGKRLAARILQHMPEALAQKLDPVALGEACDRALQEEDAPAVANQAHGGRSILSGEIGSAGVDQILQLAARVGPSVCCRLEEKTTAMWIEIFFAEGQVAWAQRQDGGSWIDRAFTPEALRRHVEEAVFETLCWKHGSFSLYEGVELPEDGKRLDLHLSLPHLLLEGMRLIDERRTIPRKSSKLEAPQPSVLAGSA
jgi:CheY-like chemotaxis protein